MLFCHCLELVLVLDVLTCTLAKLVAKFLLGSLV